MIVVSDTTPLITLLKVQHLNLLQSYFGEVQMLNAELLLIDEAKGRDVAKQMGIKIMGTIGLLIASYQSGMISAEEIRKCIDVIRSSGRHIGEKYLKLLRDKISE